MAKAFVSTVVNKVDKKGRVSVPSAFRTALAERGQPNSVTVYRSYGIADGAEILEACGADRLQEFIDEFDRTEEGSDRHLYLQAILADARDLTIDGDGRISLPADLAEFAGIGEEAAFVGQGKYFIIREPVAARSTVDSGLELRRRMAMARKNAAAARAGEA